MSKWNLEKLLSELPYDSPPDQLKAVDLKNKQIAALPKQLTFFSSLRKLDLSKNSLQVLPELGKIPTLTQINLSHNELTSIKELTTLKQLVVLNISNNKIMSLSGVEGSGETLKALVANNNELCFSNPKVPKTLQPIAELAAVETIVLSRNPLMKGITTIGEGKEHPLSLFTKCERLQKLSMSECLIPSLPSKWFLPLVSELRLAKNEISTFNSGVLVRSLKILDISNNQFESIDSLHRNTFLTQLNIRHNPCVKRFEAVHNGSQQVINNDPDFKKMLGKRFKLLQMVDGSKYQSITKEDLKRKRREELLMKQMGGDDSGEDDGADGSDVDDTNKDKLPAKAKKTDKQVEKKKKHNVAEEELPDVVYKAPEEVLAKVNKKIVKNEKVYTQSAKETKDVVATGADVLSQLRAAQSSAW